MEGGLDATEGFGAGGTLHGGHEGRPHLDVDLVAAFEEDLSSCPDGLELHGAEGDLLLFGDEAEDEGALGLARVDRPASGEDVVRAVLAVDDAEGDRRMHGALGHEVRSDAGEHAGAIGCANRSGAQVVLHPVSPDLAAEVGTRDPLVLDADRDADTDGNAPGTRPAGHLHPGLLLAAEAEEDEGGDLARLLFGSLDFGRFPGFGGLPGGIPDGPEADQDRHDGEDQLLGSGHTVGCEHFVPLL